jgi:hypothetical protein
MRGPPRKTVLVSMYYCAMSGAVARIFIYGFVLGTALSSWRCLGWSGLAGPVLMRKKRTSGGALPPRRVMQRCEFTVIKADAVMKADRACPDVGHFP